MARRISGIPSNHGNGAVYRASNFCGASMPTDRENGFCFLPQFMNHSAK